MQYHKTIQAVFLERPNRFIAKVKIGETVETVHVKNTGRCRELLLPGASVILEQSENPNRKTKYDLVTVWKENLGWVNIDSQAPNQIAGEWLTEQGFDFVKPEYVYGSSRIDFYMEKGGEKYLMEVKGCTLEIEGVGYFPDAPTQRGVKHLNELIKAAQEGYHAAVTFVIQMNGITEVRPHGSTDPAFEEALNRARQQGVKVIFLCCSIDRQEVRPLPMEFPF